MKKYTLTFALMLLLALPVFGQAAETVIPASAEETQTAQTTQTTPFGGQHGRRNRMPLAPAQTAPEAEESAAPAQTAPETKESATTGTPQGKQFNRRSPMPMNRAQMMEQFQFIDENGDGLCDICGLTHSENAETSGLNPANVKSVRDHMRSAMQQRRQAQRDAIQNKQAGQNSQQGQNSQAPGFIDADGNGVCDNLGTQQQQNQGQNLAPHGRNRR